MLRRVLYDLLWRFRAHRGPGQERYFLRQLTRLPMRIESLSIDPRGEWSLRKAQRVLAIINPEAAKQGLFFQPIEITTFGMPHRRVILVAHCVEHGEAVSLDSACPECVKRMRAAIKTR